MIHDNLEVQSNPIIFKIAELKKQKDAEVEKYREYTRQADALDRKKDESKILILEGLANEHWDKRDKIADEINAYFEIATSFVAPVDPDVFTSKAIG
jgi:uncharacterized coiled-coil DUF342 family protein